MMKRGLLVAWFWFFGISVFAPGADAGEWKRYTSFGV